MSLVAMLLLSASVVIPAQADTVLDIRQIDLFPNGDFTNNEVWTVSGSYGYGSDPLRYSNAWIEDDVLRVEHDRTVNSRTVTIWAEQNMTSGHEEAAGGPDGTFATSNGPEIILTDFDTVSFDGKAKPTSRMNRESNQR